MAAREETGNGRTKQQTGNGRTKQQTGNGHTRQQTSNNPAGRLAGPRSFQNRITHKLRQRRNYSAVSPFVKYSLFTINFIFLLAGAAFTAAGIYILVQKDKTVTSFIDFLFDPSCDLCLVGLIIVVIAFFGCGGALRESILFLRIYYIVLMIFLLLEIVLVIFVFVFYFVDDAFANIGLYPEDALVDAIKQYRDDPDMQDFIDNIQQLLSCCGASNDDNGYKDWDKNKYFECASDSPEACTVPYSCCKINQGDQINYRCGVNMLRENVTDLYAINTEGCLKGLQNLIKDNIWIVGGSVIGILIPQAIFIFCAKTLVSQIQVQMSKW